MKISMSMDNSLSKQQRELFLRQQLSAIPFELNAQRVPAQHDLIPPCPRSPTTET